MAAKSVSAGSGRRVARAVGATLLMLQLSACAARDLGGIDPPDRPLFWPPDESTARIELLGEVDKIAQRGTGGLFQRLWQFVRGLPVSSEFARPVGLSIGPGGDLYVVDQEAGELVVLDREGHARRRIDLAALGALEPVDVAVSAAGRIYISDPRSAAILALDSEGDESSWLRHPELLRPTGLAFVPEATRRSGVGGGGKRETLLVVDTAGHRLFRLAAGQVLEPAFGGRGERAGSFNFPVFISTGPAGRIWITDSMNFRVCEFDSVGSLMRQFGEHGDGPGTFARPKGVALDAAGHVYVVDALFGNCQIFDREGRLLLRFGTRGRGAGEFYLPADIAIDEDRIYIADSYNRRIQVFRYLPPGGGSAARRAGGEEE